MVLEQFIAYFGALLILSSVISLSRHKKPMNSMEKIKLLVEFIGVVVGIFLVLSVPIPSEWKISLALIIICGGTIIILESRIRRNIVFQWPIRRRKSLEETRIELTRAQCEVDVFNRNRLVNTTADLISRAKQEIYFFGLTMETLRQSTNTITTALRNNRRVHVLLFDTAELDLTTKIEQLVVTTELNEGVTRTVESLSLTLSNAEPPLTQTQKNNLQIRVHRQIPTYSAIIIDPHIETSRYIQIEPYPFGIPSENRWTFVLTEIAAKQQELIGTFLQAYMNLWNTVTDRHS